MIKPFSDGLSLRARLFRRFFYRIWKDFTIFKIKKKISGIESEKKSFDSSPVIILCPLKNALDAQVLIYLFREKELSFIGLPSLQQSKRFKKVISSSRIIYWGLDKKPLSFFREILTTLRDFNRSVVFFYRTELENIERIIVDPVLLVRMAMMANVPLLPVTITWAEIKKSDCHVRIGKKLYISPSSEEFRDVFFRRKGMRKFSRLTRDEFKLIASRIFEPQGLIDGKNI